MKNTKTQVIRNLQRIINNQPKINERFFKNSMKWIQKNAKFILNSTINTEYEHPTTEARKFHYVMKSDNSCLIVNDSNVAAYIEFGIGIKGAMNPHPLAESKENQYKYDVNNHGEKGWNFMTIDGFIIHTQGYGTKSFIYRSLISYIESGAWLDIYKEAVDFILKRKLKKY